MAAESQKVIQYIADIKPVLNKLSNMERANDRTAKKMANDFDKGFKKIGDSVNKITSKNVEKLTGNFNNLKNTTSSTSKVIQRADGSFGTFTETIKVNNKGIKTTTQSFNELRDNSVSLSDNIARLTKRAALTIPVWFAIRGGIQAVTGVIRQGVEGILEYDRALQKLRKNLQGTAFEVDQNFTKAQQVITQFSLESGKSTEDITNAIQKFATVGFDFETSLKAGIDATKLSVILFGDAADTAKAFSRGLRALATDVDDTAKSQEQITNALALTSELYETNAFELDELSSGLEKFSGTAKALGLSVEETITLLAALSTNGLKATRSGNLLRSTTLKLTGNLEKLSKVLGVEVNPEVDSTFDVFRKTTQAIAELNTETGKVQPAIAEAVRELFGVRQGEVVLDIVADMKKVNEAFDEYASKAPDIAKLDQEFEEINKSAFRQAEIIGNLSKETSKAFVTGLVGAENYADALGVIRKALELIQKSAEGAGSKIRESFERKLAFDTPFFELLRFVKKQLDDTGKEVLAETNKLNKELEKSEVKLKVGTEDKTKPVLESDRREEAEATLEAELSRLKALGATESELLKTEATLRKNLQIEKEQNEALRDRLRLEQELREEKRLQGELGNEAIKLYRIAQESGTDVAQRISEVLAGEVDFDTFIKIGGEAAKVFKKEFSDLFEQQQALAFFRGETLPGFQELRGGTEVAIREKTLQDPSIISRATRAVRPSEAQLAARTGVPTTPTVTAPQVTVNNEANITIEAGKADSREVAESVKSVIMNLTLNDPRYLKVLSNKVLNSPQNNRF